MSINNRIYVFLLLFSLVLIVFYPANRIQCRETKEQNKKITVITEQDDAFNLDPTIEDLACACYPWLNLSLFFNTSFIQNSREVRAWQTKHLDAQLFEVTTADGVTIACTYLDRHSDKLLIVGPGFTNDREIMSPFISLFDTYDVVLFDFRGHGFQESSYLHPSTLNFSLSKFFFGADAHKVTFGQKEELDVLAVINHMKQNTEHSAIYGMGVCYSSFIFLKTAIKFPGLFDKLILDGCWISLHNCIEKIKKDPRLICTPQEGGWENKCPFKYEWAKEFLIFLAHYLMGFNLEEIALLPLLESNPEALTETSLLFWQGNHDLFTPKEEFNDLWQALPCKEKTVILTNNPHIRNHWKQKELYKVINELFCELPYDQFIAHLKDPRLVYNHLRTKMLQKLSEPYR